MRLDRKRLGGSFANNVAGTRSPDHRVGLIGVKAEGFQFRAKLLDNVLVFYRGEVLFPKRVDDLAVNYDIAFSHATTGRAVKYFFGHLRLFTADDFLPECLVVILKLLELLEPLIKVHAEVGDNVPHIVGMPGVVLHDHAHDAADELNVRRERTERAKYCRYAQLRVVESFPEHLHLDDAVEYAAPKVEHYLRLLFIIHIAMNDLGVVPALTVQSPYVFAVVNGTGDGDELMLSSRLTQVFKLFKTAIHDVFVAERRERNTATKPILFFQLKNFLERISFARRIRKSEPYLRRRDITRFQALDISLERRAPERISVYELAVDFLSVASEWCGRHIDNFCFRKALQHLLPAVRSTMMCFVDDYHIEEAIGKLHEPLVDASSELVDVRDDDMCLLRNADIASLKGNRERAGNHLRGLEDTSLAPETLLAIRDVHRIVEAISDC